MAYYAFLDENNIVTEVIAGIDETQLIEGKTPEQWYGEFRGQTCIRTSFNAASNGFRKNFASIGYSWDGVGFAAPQPFPSWTLNPDTYLWQAPTPMPNEPGKFFAWDEENLAWKEYKPA